MSYVVMGNHYWGKGDTLDAAKARFRREGGRLSNGYLVIEFGEGSEFVGVDQLGRYHWKGNEPATTYVKPRGSNDK